LSAPEPSNACRKKSSRIAFLRAGVGSGPEAPLLDTAHALAASGPQLGHRRRHTCGRAAGASARGAHRAPSADP